MFFEKRYHDILTVSILHFPTSLVFSLFFSPQVPIFFPPHRRPSSSSQPSFSPFCPLFFPSLSSSRPILFIFHFLVSFPSMFTIRKISTTFNISYLIISTNTHTNFPDRRPGSPDISPTILGVHKGQVPPQQVSCLPAKVSREYRIRDEDQLIYLSRRGN